MSDLRLLLLSYDELVHVWDGLSLAMRHGDVGDPSWDELKRLRERVASLLERRA